MSSNVSDLIHDHVNEALEQADELLKEAASASGEEAKELHAQAKQKLQAANETLKAFYAKTSVQGKALASDINECVHENPWRAVGVAAAIGLLVGLVIAKK